LETNQNTQKGKKQLDEEDFGSKLERRSVVLDLRKKGCRMNGPHPGGWIWFGSHRRALFRTPLLRDRIIIRGGVKGGLVTFSRGHKQKGAHE